MIKIKIKITINKKITTFIQDSLILFKKTQHLHLHQHDIMVIFDVVSLFTKVLCEALDLILKLELVDPETLDLIKIWFTSTFFTFKGTCYE